jgi:hypothetical protein
LIWASAGCYYHFQIITINQAMKDGYKRLLIFALVFFILLSGLIYITIKNSKLRPNRKIHGWNTEEQIKKEKEMRSSEEKSVPDEFYKSN